MAPAVTGLRGRAFRMLFPYLTVSASGLRRIGPARWRAEDNDPHFKLPLKLYRPGRLILVLDGIGRTVEPTLFVDRGEGFTAESCARFRSAGRFVCSIELFRMPEARRIRLDPMDEPGEIGFSVWATDLRIAANWALKRLASSGVSSGPTRVFVVRQAEVEAIDFGSGLERRSYRSAADHLREVVAMPRPEPVMAPSSERRPIVSILVPTYNTEPTYLDALLASIREQPEGLTEVVFSDDGSTSGPTLAWLASQDGQPGVTVVSSGRNAGIATATNAALERARAPWITLLDHDDALVPGAVAMIVRTLQDNPDAQFVFTDEVVADAALSPKGYMLKPAYDPVLLSGVNYINHLSVYRADRLRALGGFRDGFQGSQDYDLLLRYLRDLPADRILHIPYPAYLWRRHETSFSTEHVGVAVASARRALAERYGSLELPVPVEAALSEGLHRVRFDLVRPDWPAVSVVIPSRDGHDLLAPLLDALLDRTDYPDLSVTIVDNGSTDPRIAPLYERHRLRSASFQAEITPEPFNFSRSINRGIARSRGAYILLLNNDVEVLEPGWLKEMVSCFAYEGTGIVGARLLYPDRTLQHAGVIVGAGGLAGHWFERTASTQAGPMGRLGVRQTMSAVTGAAMLVSRACIEATGPWDEENFAIAYNDVDFCLRAAARGYRTVWTPFATLIHHESASRGSDMVAANRERFLREQRNLRERHGTSTYCDPATNPWLTRDRPVPAWRALDTLPAAR